MRDVVYTVEERVQAKERLQAIHLSDEENRNQQGLIDLPPGKKTRLISIVPR